MTQTKDMIGLAFGQLTVIEKAKSKSPGKGAYWICKCVCGNITEVFGYYLRSGHTKSCGCLNYVKGRSSDWNITHGLTKNPLFVVWRNMQNRCLNPKDKTYHRYGGRGISICDEWKGPSLDGLRAFYTWATANGWKEGLQCDRIDNGGPYSPENCRWVTPKENCRNRRDNVKFEYEGKLYTMGELIELRNLPLTKTGYRSRMKRHNLTFEEAVNWQGNKNGN